MQSTSIIGVLNVTPDSFHAPSRITSLDALLLQARSFLQSGADILEIGGESTGPTSQDVSIEEELSRVIPAVAAVKKNFPQARIAVDTWKSSVAKQALDAGAHLINDVTAGRGDQALFSVVAAAGCQLVLMYAKDTSARTSVRHEHYDDVIATVRSFLLERIAIAEAAGIARSKLIFDPGLGHFVSSDPVVSFDILCRLRELQDLGPLLVSPSRKSFLEGPERSPTHERLPATLAASALAFVQGASFLRTHDIAATKKMLTSLELLRNNILREK
jgi:dihydropteroate synthase